MSKITPPAHVSVGRMFAFAVIGGLAALIVGLAAVAFAPDDGFADLAAAAVTRVFLVPLGMLAGAVTAWVTGRR